MSALGTGRSLFPALGCCEDLCGDECACIVKHTFSLSKDELCFFLLLVEYDIPDAWIAQCHGNGLVKILLVHVVPWYARACSSEEMIFVSCQTVRQVCCH